MTFFAVLSVLHRRQFQEEKKFRKIFRPTECQTPPPTLKIFRLYAYVTVNPYSSFFYSLLVCSFFVEVIRAQNAETKRSYEAHFSNDAFVSALQFIIYEALPQSSTCLDLRLTISKKVLVIEEQNCGIASQTS